MYYFFFIIILKGTYYALFLPDTRHLFELINQILIYYPLFGNNEKNISKSRKM